MKPRLNAAAVLIGALFLSGTALSATTAPTTKTAVPYPTRNTPFPRDVGAARDLAGSTAMTVTLSMKLQDQAGADALFTKLYDSSSSEFHKFLTPAEFRTRFAPSDKDVADLTAKLGRYGLSTERTGASTVRVSGTPAALEKAFQIDMRIYEVAAVGNKPSYQFHEPKSAPKVPAEVSSVVGSVLGLSTRPKFVPQILHGLKQGARRETPAATGNTIDPPGQWTVSDFSQYYHASELTSQGFTGAGRTVAIITLANFTVSDVYAYWSAVGLNVASNRVTVIPVDGGAGVPSDASGSDETTLDVEQSGGVAPGAKVLVYHAPNTSQAFVDAFVNAIEDNKAESISVSWGEWEWFDNLANSPVSDPYTGNTVSERQAFTEVFLQAAIQGQTLFAAAGDAGAYDVNRGLPPPDFSLTLSIDDPASNAYITAAGGTTLAGNQTYVTDAAGDTLTINVANERVWSWDYLVPLCNALKLDPFTCGIFPVGGGGGVSVMTPLPFYQMGLTGIQKSQPDQQLVDYIDTIPPTVIYTLPSNYAGRNVPDISANADPQTGYLLYYTSDKNGFGISTLGGTSFVAPQFNGVTAVLGQYLGSRRVGLLNIPLYEFAKGYNPYSGKDAPFNVIKYGNNDFYDGRNGYSPAAGIGTLNIQNFAKALRQAGY